MARELGAERTMQITPQRHAALVLSGDRATVCRLQALDRHDDIRRARPQTIVERTAGRNLDTGLVGAEKGDGTRVEHYGANPTGLAFFDAIGRYVITVMRSDRARYASDALWHGTPKRTGKRPMARSRTSERIRPTMRIAASQFTSKAARFQTGTVQTRSVSSRLRDNV